MQPKILLLTLLIVFLGSCAFYQRYRMPTDRILYLQDSNLNHYLINPAHPSSEVWYMSRCEISNDEIKCHITKMNEVEAFNLVNISGRVDAAMSRNDVLYYAYPEFAATLPETGTITLPVKQMEKIEVYELNQAKTYGAPILTILGFLLIVGLSG